MKFVYYIGIAFGLVVLLSVYNDVRMMNMLKAGEDKTFLLTDRDRSICEAPRYSNQHLKLRGGDGKYYSVMMNKIECRDDNKNYLKAKCDGNDCIDANYSFNYWTFGSKIVAGIIIVVVSIFKLK
jgi:hypothetical protein